MARGKEGTVEPDSESTSTTATQTGGPTGGTPGDPPTPAHPPLPSLPSAQELEARAAGAVEEAERRRRRARDHGELIQAWLLWPLRQGLKGGAFQGWLLRDVVEELGGDAGALALLEQAAGDEELDPLDREMLVRIVNDPAARERIERARGAAFAVEDAALRAKQAEREAAQAHG
jgi:hypothetical protein